MQVPTDALKEKSLAWAAKFGWLQILPTWALCDFSRTFDPGTPEFSNLPILTLPQDHRTHTPECFRHYVPFTGDTQKTHHFHPLFQNFPNLSAKKRKKMQNFVIFLNRFKSS